MCVVYVYKGYALPALLPKLYTHYASAFLFVYFGLKLLKDGQEMGDGPSEELQEVEEELIEKKDDGRQGQQSPNGQSDVEVGNTNESEGRVYGLKNGSRPNYYSSLFINFFG